MAGDPRRTTDFRQLLLQHALEDFASLNVKICFVFEDISCFCMFSFGNMYPRNAVTLSALKPKSFPQLFKDQRELSQNFVSHGSSSFV